MNEFIECVWVQIWACVKGEYELQQSQGGSVCVCVRGCTQVCVRAFLWHVCVILFNYRSGFEAEANSAIITGNTSFNILWKSTPRVSFCTSKLFIQPARAKLGRPHFRFLPRHADSFAGSRFTFVFPNGDFKRPFPPHFWTASLSNIYAAFTGKRDRERRDLSIKDEQHLKCIKRGDECSCSGRERCKLWFNAWLCILRKIGYDIEELSIHTIKTFRVFLGVLCDFFTHIWTWRCESAFCCNFSDFSFFSAKFLELIQTLGFD